MEKLEINLLYNPDHFRELYYRNGEGNILTANQTKRPIQITLFFILITIAIYFTSFRFDKISWLIFLLSIITFILIVSISFIVIKHVKWKAGIEKFLTGIGKYKSYKLSLTANSLETKFDSDIIIETWDKFETVHIDENHISLMTKEGQAYLFPAKSMTTDEFKNLKEFIISKIK